MTFDSVHDEAYVKKIIQDWKLTPATVGYKLSRGSWIPAKHLMYISAKVAKAIQRGNGRIIISAPPRHGKSQLVSIYTPAWILERFPQFRTMLTAYGADLAEGFSRQVRDIFLDKENHSLLTTRVRRDVSRAAAFLTEQDGGMYAVGLGGAITGRGADVLLIDDYIKEIKEALSPAYRDYVWNWFVTTAFTRLEPNGTCIIIATRWHSDDLIGRILTNFPGQWEYIEIPAIAEGETTESIDLFGRHPGEALFPERYPIEKLLESKDLLGTPFFSALYQQKPIDETAKLTDGEWLKIIPNLPPNLVDIGKWGRIWDLAATEGGGDYTVGTRMVWDKSSLSLYIDNVVRDQFTPKQAEDKVREIAMTDGTATTIYIEQEPGASGKALVEHYQRTVLPEFKVEAVPVVTNKLVRAQPFMAAAESGKVFLVQGSWNDIFKREFDAFPSGAFDDQVDTASAGYTKLSGRLLFTASWGRNTRNVQPKTQNALELRKAQFKMASESGSGRLRGATFGRR